MADIIVRAESGHRNHRRNHLVTFRGKTQCLAAWAEETSIPISVLSDRINKLKWPVDRALSEPISSIKSKGRKRTTHSHGKNGSSLTYRSWIAMKSRCCNPNHADFPRWGGAGITVCERWRHSFEAFLADMGERPSKRHSIDRTDNSRGYEPGNCRWATGQEQQRNTRQNHLITFNGETKCLIQWATELSMSPEVLSSRLKRGWPLQRAMTEPCHPYIKSPSRILPRKRS